MVSTITDYEPIIEIIEDIFGELHMHNEYKGQLSVDCPICSYDIKGLDHGDGKGNLEINYFRKAYKCWACYETNDTHGSLRSLIRKYGNEKQLQKYDLFMPEDIPEGTEPKYAPVKLPKEFIPFTSAGIGIKLTHHYKQAKMYLDNRHITDEMIKAYNIGFCYYGEYANRIIIPSLDENLLLNYFIARSYQTNPFLKYKNPEAQKDKIIWNEFMINWIRPVYIVEGVFDSIFLPNSIPMLGKVMSEKLFNLLYERAREVVIVLDGDAYDSAVNLYRKLNGGRLWGKIWIIKLPIDKDIADLQGKLDDYKKIQLD